LGRRIVLISGAAEPANGLLVILRHALTGLKANAHIALRGRIALLGGFAHFLEGLPGAAIRLH
jgi:hypothetical protein